MGCFEVSDGIIDMKRYGDLGQVVRDGEHTRLNRFLMKIHIGDVCTVARTKYYDGTVLEEGTVLMRVSNDGLYERGSWFERRELNKSTFFRLRSWDIKNVWPAEHNSVCPKWCRRMDNGGKYSGKDGLIKIKKNDMTTLVEKWYDNSIQRTMGETIMFDMLDELNGRKGLLDIDNVDEDIQEEIFESLLEIIIQESE